MQTRTPEVKESPELKPAPQARGSGAGAPERPGAGEAPTELEPIEVCYNCTAWSNTYHVTLLFSIKKKKFVKPVMLKHLKVWYKVLPGTYIKVESYGSKWKTEYSIKFKLVRIERDEKWGTHEELLNCAIVNIASDKEKNDFSVVNNNEIVKDVVAHIPPRYHGYPWIDFDKIYSDANVEELLELIKNDRLVYLYNVEE